jgi:glycerophosphoryl diester phosphodiesterase
VNRPLIVAHRGVAIGAAENSLESFAKAIDVGADMIEFDVRLTGDGELIAFHDSQINGVGLVKLIRRQIADATGTQPALFAEILDLCAGKIKLDIELKEDGYIDRVVKILNDSTDLGQVIVTSFLPAALEQTKTLLPGVKTGLLVGVGSPKPYVRTRLRELYPVGTARRIGAAYIAPNWKLARLGVLRRASAAGMPCLVWTVNEDNLIRRFASDPRVKAIITDRAERALSITAELAKRQ